jgi:HEAT repeat protein
MSEERDVQVTGDGNVVGDGSTSQVVKAERGSTIKDVIQAIVSGQVIGDVHIGDKIYTRSNLEELNDYLDRAVAAYEARMYQLVARPPAPPDQPYKFLYAFEIEDADIFFGRDAASETLHQTLCKDRLTVLHAKSGAGKTSLLNAGLSPRLIREGRLPVYARAYGDPVRAIKRAIAPPSLGPWPELLPQLTLHEFLGMACQHLSRQIQELVIILDQFEEFFIFWPERDHRQTFVHILADCLDDKSLPVRFIVGIRGDYFTHLATFQGHLPHIFHNEYYLEGMTREEAQSAIIAPLARLGRPVTYEPALLNTLLDDLARGGIELPHLQIICTRLYDVLAKGGTTITLASYEELGRAERVLSSYLNDVLDRLPVGGGSVAREVLKELVSSESTKRVLSYDTLAARIEAEKDELDDVLTRLVNARLLRRNEVSGKITYEMAHEYLIGEMKEWLDQSDLAFKQAEELLAREVANWRVHGTLIPRDRLELLYEQREHLKGLEDEAWECILRSVVEDDFAVEDWTRLAGEIGEKIFITELNNPDEETRLAATRGLGVIWKSMEVIRLGDRDGFERMAAAESLAEVGDPRAAEPLIAALQDEYSSVRRAAAETLGGIGDPRAVVPLIATLRDNDTEVRGTAVEALVRLGKPAVEPLIVLLQDADGTVRLLAAVALQGIGDPQAVEPLISGLQDEDSDVRRTAAEALSEVGDSRAVEAFIAALTDDDWYVKQTAAEALGELGDPRAVEPLIAALRDEDRRAHESAVKALVRLGSSSADPVITALRDKDANVRRLAAKALGELGDLGAIEPLIASLRDESLLVRQTATEALGRLGDLRAVEPLIAILEDEAKEARRAAAEALGELGDPSAVAPLISVLGDEDWLVCLAAAEALGELGDPCAVESLTVALRDESWVISNAAATALGKIDTPESLAALEEWSALNHPEQPAPSWLDDLK